MDNNMEVTHVTQEGPPHDMDIAEEFHIQCPQDDIIKPVQTLQHLPDQESHMDVVEVPHTQHLQVLTSSGSGDSPMDILAAIGTVTVFTEVQDDILPTTTSSIVVTGLESPVQTTPLLSNSTSTPTLLTHTLSGMPHGIQVTSSQNQDGLPRPTFRIVFKTESQHPMPGSVSAPQVVFPVTASQVLSSATSPQVVSCLTAPQVVSSITEPQILSHVSPPQVVSPVTTSQVVSSVTAPQVVVPVTATQLVPVTATQIATATAVPQVVVPITAPQVTASVSTPQDVVPVTAPQMIIPVSEFLEADLVTALHGSDTSAGPHENDCITVIELKTPSEKLQAAEISLGPQEDQPPSPPDIKPRPLLGQQNKPLRQPKVPPISLKVQTVKLPVFKPMVANPIPVPEQRATTRKRGPKSVTPSRRMRQSAKQSMTYKAQPSPKRSTAPSKAQASPKKTVPMPTDPPEAKHPAVLPKNGSIVLPKRDRPGVTIRPVKNQIRHPPVKPNYQELGARPETPPPPPGKYACKSCEKTFVTSFSLRRHQKNVHKDQEVGFSRKKQQKCPMCEGEAGASFKDLRIHLETVHQVEIACMTLSFQTKDDFMKWKASEEQQTKSIYVQRWSSSVAKNGRVCTYYYCHRSGFFRCTSTGKRHTKSSGSNKMNSMCPAHMKFRKFEDGRIEVEYVKTHVGHTCEVQRMRLTPDEKKSIAAKISNNIPLSAILEEVRNSVSLSTNVERIHLLSRRDVLNIAKEFNLKFAAGKPGDRASARVRSKVSNKQTIIRSRHLHSMKLNVQDVIVYGTGWLVKSESTDGILYNIERSGIECIQPCTTVCNECNCCTHQFRCSCIENTKKNVMCKHIHLVCRKLMQIEEHQEHVVQQDLGMVGTIEEEQQVNLVVAMDPIDYHETQIGMHARVVSQPNVKASLDEHFQRACEELNSELEDLGDVEEQQRAVQLLMETINRLRAAKRSKLGN